jgi:putative PIN family toxin of toxin-antitoxin system
MAIKVVLDTNILVSALINEKGKPRKILNLFYDKEILVYYSDDIIEEYKDVLSRKELGINPEKVGKVINAVRKIGLRVEPVKSIFEMPDDSDRIFYDTAKLTSSWLITGNIKHYPAENFVITISDFCEKFRI